MIDWISANKQWLFDGLGVAVIMAIGGWFLRRRIKATPTRDHPVADTNRNTLVAGMAPADHARTPPTVAAPPKATTHILFIDDDQKFKVVDILKKSGWTYTRRTSDVGSLDDPMIQQAEILFVDVQGVGRRLQFKDEGLGLAKAIKDKYPAKKVVIYSAQTQGERFHEALRKADDFLPKNADPYEFQQLTERLAADVQNAL
jgi:hypothetical protein